MQQQKIIVVKLGSYVLHQEEGIDEKVIQNLVENLVEFKKQGLQFILVSSGAVASGKKVVEITSKKKITKTQESQIYSSIGQVHLMNTYQKYFLEYGIPVAQALLTRRDFSERDRYASMKLVFQNLLENDVVPIINENDVVSPEELDFSDNDQLSAYVAAMMNVDKLIILTDVEGLYTAHPEEGGELISQICLIDDEVYSYVSDKKSSLGTGGMRSKLETAKFMMDMGIPLQLANGKKGNVIQSILEDKDIGTIFSCESEKKINDLRRWLKMGAVPEGEIKVSTFIANLLKEGRRSSILSIGVEEIVKDFKKGDVVEVQDEEEKVIGLGIAKIDSKEFCPKESKNSEGKSQIVIHTDYFINL